MKRLVLFLASLLAFTGLQAQEQLPSQPAKAQAPDFNREIAPLLSANCVECHRTDKMKGDLLLDTRANALKGGEGGASLVPGDPAKSLLLERVKLPHDHDDVMPPKGDPLRPEQTALLERWITAGAPWPAETVLSPMDEAQIKALATASAKKIRSLDVYPPSVALETKRDYQQIVVVATFDDDVTIDVTSRAEMNFANPALAKREGTRLLPVADGETQLVVKFGGMQKEVPLKVTGATADRPVSFNLDVMPVFMREGCNSGACHGSSRGQDGFGLTLFGFDPRRDYQEIVYEMSGRRVNLARPDQSFLLLKSMEEVPHTGGKLFDRNSKSFATIKEWIENGVPEDPAETATVVGIDILPGSLLLEGKGAKHQLIVRARFSDGTDRDVSDTCVFITNNESVVAVDRNGLLTAGDRGEAFIMARYDVFTTGSQVIVIPENLEYTKPSPARKNAIDDLVHAKLHKLRILPSGQCNDEVFLRRVYADVIGRLPTREEYDKFMADGSPEKRAAVIDVLLEDKAFTEMWVMKWAELLQVHSSGNDRRYYKGALLYYGWLAERIANEVPFNEIVADLLTSTGGTFTEPAANYYEMERDTLKVAENAAQVFMGMRIQCAQCHNHPFDRWTMDDYYGFASFFTQIGRKRATDPREYVVFNKGSGEFNHPVTKKPQPPKFLGGEIPEIKSGEDRREVLAEWLASPDNPYFAKNLANIVWHHFTGVGIIDPVDDVRISNPASNPQLLDALGKQLAETNFDFKGLVREICNSATYQLSTQPNDSNRSDERNFSHASIRRLRAEVMLDAISQVTETPNKFKGLPIGARAVQIADGSTSTYFLTTFGRASRTSVCSCEVKVEPNLSQALHLLNGDSVHNRILEGKLIERRIAEKKTDAEILDELYVRVFGRGPTEVEKKRIFAAIAAVPEERKAVLEDTLWALLNSKEFIFNH